MSAPSILQPPDAPTYEAFYGFAQSPFTLAPDPRFLYRSASHDEALGQILQSIRRAEGFVILTGDIGTGKTTLCRALLQQLDKRAFTSLVLNPFVSVDELLREVLLDFGIASREMVRSGKLERASRHLLISTLHDFLLSLIPIRGRGVLIIDEAQHLTPAVLEQIRVLSNLETNEEKLLQIVLVGQLNLLDVLAAADMRQLDQRISLRATLKPLVGQQVDAYLAHRLVVAGGTRPVSFEPAAVDRIRTFTGGVPRVINLLCDRALMAAAGAGQHAITPEIIDHAAAVLELKPQVQAPVAVATRPHTGRWTLAAAAVGVAVVVALLALSFFFLPLDRFVDVAMPAAPSAPPPRTASPLTARPVPPEGTVPAPPVRRPAPVVTTPAAAETP